MRPTLCPRLTNARARLTATVVLPTPPLPLATATRFFTPGMGWRSGWGWGIGPGGIGLGFLPGGAKIEKRNSKYKTRHSCERMDHKRQGRDLDRLKSGPLVARRGRGKPRPYRGTRSCVGTVAFFVFFAGAAGAGIVAAYFCACTDGLWRFGLLGARLVLQFFLLALLLA